jgi:hypothetical protein
MKSLKIDWSGAPFASSGPQLCQMVKVTGSAGAAVGCTGTVVGCTGAEVAAGAVAGAPPQALRAMEVTTSKAIIIEILLLFILSSFLSYGVRQKGEIR